MNNIDMQLKLQRDEFTLDTAINIPGHGVSVILGPSGSGKTTLLRVLAGLDKVDQGFIRKSGNIWLDSTSKINISPQKRNVGMVFQDYALFEHMTVEANVGFSLNAYDRNKKVPVWLKKLDINHLAKRYPHQLSGGQRQRVALARALITEPELLLLDEPFAALDAHLRIQLREQLLELVSQFKQPVLMVTHDLNEARYLADYVGVMINGVVKCMHNADELFSNPPSLEVARVLGWRNFLPVSRIKNNSVAGAWGEIEFDEEPCIDVDWLAIRHEHIKINTPQAWIEAELIRVTLLDGSSELICRLIDGTRFYLQCSWHETLPDVGDKIRLELPTQHIKKLPETATPISTSKNIHNNLSDKYQCLNEAIMDEKKVLLQSV